MENTSRIAIVGAPGSGKSSLARALGARLDLPVFHMGHIHWKPDWVERSRAEKMALARDVLVRDAWVFEGGFSAIQEERLARAEAVVWLDLPYTLRMWRVLRRTITWYGRVRPDMQKGCPEGRNPEMLEFWRYIWRTRHSARDRLSASLDPVPNHLTLYHLRSQGQVRRFLERLPRRQAPT